MHYLNAIWKLFQDKNNYFYYSLPERSDEKTACAAICDKMGLKGYQVYFNLW